MSLTLCLLLLVAFVISQPGPRPDPDASAPARLLAAASTEGRNMNSIPLPVDDADVVATHSGSLVFLFKTDLNKVWRISIPDGAIDVIDFSHPITDMKPSANGQTLYVAAPDGVVVHDTRTGNRRKISLSGAVSEIAILKNESALFAAMGSRGVWRVDLPSGAVKRLTSQISPFFLTLDSTERYLFVSYQNGGPGGRDGHDTVERFELESGSVVTSQSGPPMVGGPVRFSSATNQIWVQMWDACYTKNYDHQGCQFVPGSGYQIFRASDLRHIRTLSWQRFYTRPAVFTRGRMAVVPGDPLRVFDAMNLQVLEQLPIRADLVSYAEEAGRLFAVSGNKLYFFDSTSRSRLEPPVPYVQHFAFDGTMDDAIEQTSFHFEGDPAFVSGKVGQALRLAKQAGMRMKSPAAWRMGESKQTTLAFWVRPFEDSTIIARKGPHYPWALQWKEGIFQLVAGGVLASSAAPAGVWRHVTITQDSGQFSLLIDGRPVGGGVAQPGNEGGDFTASGRFDIDELSMFAGVLDSEAVLRLIKIGI